jgi:hypothetical protein
MDRQTLAWRRICQTFGILKTFDTSLLSRTTYFFAEFSLVAMVVSVTRVTMESNHKQPVLSN